ncbi:MAG: ABC transporter permease [Candidatus Hodarchaeota archaeon]
MKILTKKIFREIRFNKFRSMVIILTVMLTITLGIGLFTLKQSLDESLAAHHKTLNNADLRIRLNNYNLTENNVLAWLENPKIHEAGISDLEGRIFHYSSIIYKNKTYKAYLIGIGEHNTINQLKLVKGTDQLSDSQPLINQLSTNQVLLERHFGKMLFGGGAELNDELTIQINNTSAISMEISGFVVDSDYLYPVDEQTGLAAVGNLPIIYMPLKILKTHLQVNGINEILVKTITRSHSASQIADQALNTIIGGNQIETVLYWDKTPDMEFYEFDQPMEKLGLVFGIFGLLAGATAIYNSLSKLVLAQRTYIGVYGALGAKKHSVLTHYIGVGITLGIIGTVLGWIGAIIINFAIVNFYSYYYGLLTTRIGFNPVIWIGGSSFGLIIMFISSLIATLPVLHLTPREAMVAPYTKTQLGKEPLLERIASKVGLFRSLTSKLPLRTVFMNKKRSLTTTIAIATSMIIFVTSISLVSDILYSIDQNYSNYEKYDVKVLLREPTSEKEIKDWCDQIEGINIVEGYISTQVFLSDSNNDPQRVSLEAFHINSSLREYHIIKGNIKEKNELTKDKLLVGSTLAEDLNLKVGDQLNLTINHDNTFFLEVAGITGELYDNTLLWTVEALREYIGISENVNALAFSYTNGLVENEKAQIGLQIKEKWDPYVYAESGESLETMKSMIESSTSILFLIGFLGLGALVLFTFSSMSLAMMDREMEFLALRAMGSKKGNILKILFLENFFYGSYGIILGVPLTISLLRPAFDFIQNDIYITIFVPIELWIIVVGLIMFSVLLSTSILTWRTWHSSLPNMLRNRMIS